VSQPALLTPLARRELVDAIRTIAMDNERAARGLNDAVALAARRLGSNPSLGSNRPYLPSRYRVWPLRRYSYLLVYDPATEPVLILRVVHMRRDLPRLLAHLAG
jgi:toxin ParE1/3/4